MKIRLGEAGQAFAIFLIVAAIRFFPFFFGRSLFFGDNFSLQVPQKIWTAFWLKQGVLPLWNPLLFSGISWAGDISHTPFSPYVLPFVVFPPALALNFLALVSFVLTALGMYLLCRQLVRHHWWSVAAGGLWALSSIWAAGANNLPTLQSLSWFPWILLAGYRLKWSPGRIAVFSLTVAGQLAAGYPPHLLLSFPAAVALSLAQPGFKWRPWLLSWISAAGLAFGLAAPITLPFVMTILESTRQIQSTVQAVRGSLHPVEILKIFLPTFFDAPLLGIRWGPAWNFSPTPTPYFTWLGLLIFLTSSWKKLWQKRWVKIAILTATVSFALAFGERLPGYKLLLELPGFSAVRTPSSWLVLTEIFGLLLLAEAGKSWRPPKVFVRWNNLLLIASVASLLAFVMAWSWPESVWNLVDRFLLGSLSRSTFHTVQRDQLILLLLMGSFALASLTTWLAWKLWQRQRQPIFCLLLLAEAFLLTQTQVLFAPSSAYASPSQLKLLPFQQLLSDPHYRTLTRNLNAPYTDFASYWEAVAVRKPFSDSFVDQQELQTANHLIRLRNSLTPDWNMVANIPVVNGYTTLLPADYQQIWEPTATDARINLLSTIDLKNPLLQEWSVKYFVVDKWFAPPTLPSDTTVVFDNESVVIYERPTLPRYRFADNKIVNLSHYRETPNRVEFETANSNNQTSLIIADRFEKGWTARVNGKKVTVENYQGMRKIPIDSGENKIILEYWPPLLFVGLTLSITSMIIVIVLGSTVHFRRHFHSVKRIL